MDWITGELVNQAMEALNCVKLASCTEELDTSMTIPVLPGPFSFVKFAVRKVKQTSMFIGQNMFYINDLNSP